MQPGEAPPGAAQLGRGRVDRPPRWELRALASPAGGAPRAPRTPQPLPPSQSLTRFSGGTTWGRRGEAEAAEGPWRQGSRARAERPQLVGGLGVRFTPGCAGPGTPPPHSRFQRVASAAVSRGREYRPWT